jgi:hypothetical protein
VAERIGAHEFTKKLFTGAGLWNSSAKVRYIRLPPPLVSHVVLL